MVRGKEPCLYFCEDKRCRMKSKCGFAKYGDKKKTCSIIGNLAPYSTRKQYTADLNGKDHIYFNNMKHVPI